METISDDQFTVSLTPSTVGAQGCSGNSGQCPYRPEYVVELAYCSECETTDRSCRYLKHLMDHPDFVELCATCLIRVRPWNVLVAISALVPDPGPPPQIVV